MDGGVGIDTSQTTPSSSSSGHSSKCWWPVNVNTGGVLRHLADIPGIKKYRYYIGQLYKFFGLHREDDTLASMS